MLKIMFTGLFCLFLAACGNEEFEGDYVTKSSEFVQQNMSFTKDGKVKIFVDGNPRGIFIYEKDGDKIKVFGANGITYIFTVEKDGGLFGDGLEFVKIIKKIIRGNYVSKPDPDFNPEYAPVYKLFFGSDGKVKAFYKYYDLGKFIEEENILKYKIDGDNITLFIENGTTQIVTIRENGNLLFYDDGNIEFIKQEEWN